MPPLVTLRDRSTQTNIVSTYKIPFDMYSLSYGSVMPGGMATAELELPVDWLVDTDDLTGTRFIVEDSMTPLWWGDTKSVTSFIRNGMRYKRIEASAPWEIAKRTAFNMVYDAGIGWTGDEILKAIVLGNMPDVQIDQTSWDSHTLDFTPITFSSNVQDAILECLRIGCDAVSPWSFLILPPRNTLGPSISPLTFASELDDLTGWTTFGTSPGLAYDLFHRNAISAYCWHNTGIGTSYIGRDFPSTGATYYVGCWFFYPADAVDEEYQFLTFYNTNGDPVTGVVVNSTTDVMTIRNYIAAESYSSAATLTMGRGCWHFLVLGTTVSAVAGVATAYLDFKEVISATGKNTGPANLKGVYIGNRINSVTSGRGLNFSEFAADTTSAANLHVYLRHRSAETLPYSKIFKLNTSTYDVMLTLQHIGDRFSMNDTIDESANLVSVIFTGGESYLSSSESSVTKRGQLPLRLSVTKITNRTAAQYIADRYVAVNAVPRTSMSPFSFTMTASAKEGWDYPLSHLRAGLRFAIRDLFDKGIMYIGHCRYTFGNGQESVDITPKGAPADLPLLMALAQQRDYA